MSELILQPRQMPDGDVFVPAPAGMSFRAFEKYLRQANVDYQLDREGRGARLAPEAYVVLEGVSENVFFNTADDFARLTDGIAERSVWHDEALRLRDALNQDPIQARDWLADYPLMDTLDAHQISAVALASHPAVLGLCLFDEQGLGKTVEALFAFDRLYDQGLVEKVIVFAPKNMLLEWVHDLKRFFGEKYACVAVSGSVLEKRESLNIEADMYVTNFESADRLGIRLKQILQGANGKSMLIVDESFFVKNADARRTRSIKTLRSYARRCLVLCGTPAPNSAVDLVEQFNIADGGAAFAGVVIPEDRDEARAVIGEQIEAKGVYLRRLKEKVLTSLPGRTFSKVIVQLGEDQRRLYTMFRDGLIRDVLAISNDEFSRHSMSYMAQRAKLLQICSNPSVVDPNFDGVSAKSEALDRLLEDLIERRGEKVLLWSYFTATIEQIMSRYGKYNPVRIDGKVTEVTDRRAAVQKFQTDDETMLFIANPAAAGAGLTLHRARFAIYESMSNQAAHYLQSLDRIHRRGQTREVEYLILICDETIEIREYERLLAKEADARELLGDNVSPPPSRDAFLEELLAENEYPT